MTEPEAGARARAVNPADPSTAYGSVSRPTHASRTSAEALAADAIDVALVARLSNRETDALAALYDRWSSTVRSLVARIVGDPSDTDEVVEEVFWQLWQQADRFDATRGRVAVWMLTIARSRALDRARARKRRRDDVPETRDDGSSRLAQIPSAEDAVDPGEFADQRQRVSAALGALPPDQRDVVMLAYFSGLSQSEIAEHLGVPLGTIKTRTRLAFSKLRETLSVLWDDPS